MKLVPLITPRTHLIFRDHEIAAQRSPPPARASRCLGPEWAAHYLLCFHLLEAHTSHNITIQSSIAMFINVLKKLFYSQTMIGKS